MINKILSHFPPHTHPLTLVSDPDRLLMSEKLMKALMHLGFKIIHEEDPVLLRLQLTEKFSATEEAPLIIMTDGDLEDLPYDLWQIAHRVSFSLHQFFPRISYPILQTLSPDQINKLGQFPAPKSSLSRNRSIEYVLEHVFDVDVDALTQPSRFIAWLNDYHHQTSLLPDVFCSFLISRLQGVPAFIGWDIDRLVRDATAFSRFIQQQWYYAVRYTRSNESIAETSNEYKVHFDKDHRLQDLIPSLVRNGALIPIDVGKDEELPSWVIPGVTCIDPRIERCETLLEQTGTQLNKIADSLEDVRWVEWEEFSREWAELSTCLGYTDLSFDSSQIELITYIKKKTDALFAEWLFKNYSSLGSQRLPTPHHVYHIPHYIEYLRSLKQIENAVLLVMDGMSLTDWQVIKSTWARRHQYWKMITSYILAQVPTITSISRYALISGLRPVEFISKSGKSVSEAQAWELFWSRKNIPAENCKLLSLSYDRQLDQMPEIENPRIKYWCLVDDTIDRFSHRATLGSVEQQASLNLWLDPNQDQNSLPLEGIIDGFLERGYSIFVASDHGHVEAKGIGKPNEGLLAKTRGKRVRLYHDVMAATRIQSGFSNTVLWENDGLLPNNMIALMPKDRDAFTTYGEVVVSHGGISLDEAIVPLVQISKVSS